MKKILYILLLLFSVMLVCSCDTDSDSVPKEDRHLLSDRRRHSQITFDLDKLINAFNSIS